MTPETAGNAAAFAAVFAALYVAHQVADHWIQTQHQANTKGTTNGAAGYLACAAHVATYTATCVAATISVAAILGFLTALSPVAIAAGAVINAGSHFFADLRTPLKWLAARTAHLKFWHLGVPRQAVAPSGGYDDNPLLGTGSYALDQSWHYLWLGATALITVAGI